jgi:hypothetical protein
VPFGVNAARGVPTTGFGDWQSKSQLVYGYLSSLLGWDGTPSTMRGMFYDSMQGWGNIRNYRQEHWRTTAYPLTLDRLNNNAVYLLNIWGNVAFADAVSQWLRQHSQILVGDDAYYQLWYHMPFVDAPGHEITNYSGGVWSPPSDETYCSDS